ncbi:hypothetical protein FCU45_08905 [Sulfurimonas crateris]|uniref:Uncharacterized protein n=1 Tax=Sulfurimonas crateris TaxID=2574727 RepID=A0A4U2Z6I4_9BACT|nr:hypothetical protein [Sulfurimonas crateris]TKI69070.1 hypothetical protein FCU45_08905 [Sulfurimonas crateris]
MSESLIEQFTKMNREVQNQKLRLFARVDTSTKLKILERQKPIFHKLRSSYSNVENAILTLVSLILAIDDVLKELDTVNLNVIKLKNKSVRQKAKRDKLFGYWAVIRTLKLEQDLSFRQIAQYLKKYHKLEVAHSTLYKFWSELETIKNEAKGEN